MTDGIGYEGSVYRPPSEAYSLIIQSTIGCSHNACTFCSMYKGKRFRIRKPDDVMADLTAARSLYRSVKRVFFADGDALIRDTQSQLELIRAVYRLFPECERVTSYASPKSIALKSDAELSALREAGLKMLYIGLESGSDDVLKRIDKGCGAAEIVDSANRSREAGFKLSVTAILGLDAELTRQHALGTAEAFSLMKPDYIGMLALMLEPGAKLYEDYVNGAFEPPSHVQILNELKLLLENTDSEGSVFRANHASNYIDLRGTLNEDRARLVEEVTAALAGRRAIKPEFYRGL